MGDRLRLNRLVFNFSLNPSDTILDLDGLRELVSLSRNFYCKIGHSHAYVGTS